MKITLLTAIPLWHPGTNELVKRLRSKGIEVNILDIFHGRCIDENGELINLIPFQLKGNIAKIYMRFFRQRFARKHTINADILDIHFVEPLYAKYVPSLNKKYICSLFGSDLFRTTEYQKSQQRSLFASCDRILLSRNMLSYFEASFTPYPEKYLFNQYGSERIDLVYNYRLTKDKKKIRGKLNIPEGKIILTCGYNGKEEQQHLRMLNELNKLDLHFKEQLFLLFPITYGGNDDYRQQLKSVIQDSGIEHCLITDYLSDEQLAELRIISNISVNTQTTDALASSVKEAMVSGDIMIAGEWLPYEIYEEMGVYFRTTSFEDLSSVVRDSILNFSELQQASLKNAEIIRNFASWESLIDRWVVDYQELFDEGR